LNWLDLVIAVIIVLSVYLGYRKGFLRRLLGIAGIILGFILALKFYDQTAGLFTGLLKTNLTITRVICFLLIIIVVFSLAVWIARFIAGLNSGTTMIDKLLGVVFGLIEGLIIASVLIVNMSYLNLPDNKTRESSVFYPKVYKVAPMIFDKIIALSPELNHVYEEYKKTFLYAS
jgi:membrane protein required for colicin V production